MPPKKSTKSDSSRIAEITKAIIKKHCGVLPITAKEAQWPYLSSGSIVVDDLIGGSIGKDGKSVCPGFPRRRITEIYGPESSGKTTLALSAVRQAQKEGEVAMFLDFEHALHVGYSKAIGVVFDDKMLFYAPDTMEQGLQMLTAGIMAGVGVVVVDSVAAMVPKAELEKGVEDAAKVGVVAALMAINLPKMATRLSTYPKLKGENAATDPDHHGTAVIFLNQERASISTGGGRNTPTDPNSAGGKALKFYASCRLRLSKLKTEKVSRKSNVTGKTVEVPYGTLTQVKVVKDKLDGKQGHTGNIFIRYGFGVDNYISVIESALPNGVVKREGAYYSFKGSRIQGREKFRQFLIDTPAAYKEIEKMVREAILIGAKPVADEEMTEDDVVVEAISEDMEVDSEVTEAVVEDEEGAEGEEDTVSM